MVDAPPPAQTPVPAAKPSVVSNVETVIKADDKAAAGWVAAHPKTVVLIAAVAVVLVALGVVTGVL